jgi:hypothetical protein
MTDERIDKKRRGAKDAASPASTRIGRSVNTVCAARRQ